MSDQPVSQDSHWSYPNVQGAGFVWMGSYTAQPGDYEALEAIAGEGVVVQEQSTVGCYHPTWNSAWYETVDADLRPGGAGSKPYEAQWCGEGVRFAKEPIWHINKEGDMVKEVPANCGAYHREYDGDGYVNYAGPEPGSEAAKILGTTAYHWDKTYCWYYAGPDPKKPWWEGGDPKTDACPLCGK